MYSVLLYYNGPNYVMYCTVVLYYSGLYYGVVDCTVFTVLYCKLMTEFVVLDCSVFTVFTLLISTVLHFTVLFFTVDSPPIQVIIFSVFKLVYSLSLMAQPYLSISLHQFTVE